MIQENNLSDTSDLEHSFQKNLPQDMQEQWQNIVDILAIQAGVPAALIMKFDPPYLEVDAASHLEGNPYEVGERQKMTGLYCEKVIKTDEKLQITNALKDEDWHNNPDIELNMIAYLGLPLYWPDGSPYGTICILDRKENRFSPEIEELMQEFKGLIEIQLRANYQKSRLVEVKNALTERVKELSCFFQISRLLVDKTLKLEDIYIRVAKILPDHFQYPEKACARIVVNNEEFTSCEFDSSGNSLVEEIRLDEGLTGKVEVCYFQDRDCKNEGQKKTGEESVDKEPVETEPAPPEFLEEEKELLNAVARFLTDIIEKKNFERVLKTTRNELFTTLYSIGNGVITADEEGRVEMMNPVAQNMTGWDFSEAEGRPLEEVFHIISAETGERVNSIEKVLNDGQIVGLANDTTLITRKGDRLQIADSAAPIKDISGRISGAVLVFSDVTREYEYKEELEKSRDMLQATLNSLSANICVLDRRGCITRVNQSWIEFARENEAELEAVGEGVNYLEICREAAGDDSQKARELARGIRRVMLGEVDEFALEYPCYSPDKKRWFIGRVTPYRVNNNNKTCSGSEAAVYERGAVIVHEDITRRKEAELALVETEKKYSTMINNYFEMIYLHDLEGNIREVNRAVLEKMGYSRPEILNMTVFDLHPGQTGVYDRKQTISLWQSWQLGERQLLEREHICSDGSTIPVEISTGRVELEGEDLIVAFVRDISERRENEQQIKYLSFHDNLTSLYNRSFMEEEIKRMDSQRQLPLSIIMIDINGLNLINNSYGYDKGDEILVEVAGILESSLSQNDVLARWGEDEFIILLSRAADREAKVVSDRIREKAEAVEIGREGIPVSLGMGSATKSVMDRDIYEVLREAEAQMAQDKLTQDRSIKSRLVSNLLSTLEAKSNETAEHAQRMAFFAARLGEKIGLKTRDLNNLYLLASLHDIGKVTISEDILAKPGELTPGEWEIIEEHPEKGYQIASATEDFAGVAEEILSHHERWDGDGCPRGLAAEEIPLLARIISIADAYDAMTNGRPYKEAMSRQEALRELKDCAGSQFDPELVENFVEIMQE